MTKAIRTIAALILPLALAACFLIPGEFGSTLDVRKDGRFAFTYSGEILFQSPDKMGKKAVWNEKAATCYKDDVSEPQYDDNYVADDSADAISESSDLRACTPAEIAKLKKNWDSLQAEKAAKDAKEAEQFAQMFGFNPSDDASMRKLAAQLAKQAGWKSATYVGNGKFMVDYAISARLDHDFVFPIIGEAQTLTPFVIIQRRADGSALITAPAYSAGAAGGLGGGFGEMMAMSRGMDSQKNEGPSRTKGQFTITTDAEIRSNNTTDGPVVAGKDRKLIWEVGNIKDPAPRAILLVKP